MGEQDTLINRGLVISYIDRLKKELATVPTLELVRCSECKYWDQNSGLTARKCIILDRFTKQYEWCCWAKPKKVNENA